MGRPYVWCDCEVFLVRRANFVMRLREMNFVRTYITKTWVHAVHSTQYSVVAGATVQVQRKEVLLKISDTRLVYDFTHDSRLDAAKDATRSNL